jgi:hypothetical protein
MNQSLLTDIEPYFYQPSKLDNSRFELIKSFIKDELSFKTFESRLWSEYSSASLFEVRFDKNWEVVEPHTPIGEAHFSIRIHVSERGPFITSRGDELQPYKETDWRPAGDSTGIFRPTDIAEAKAKEIAQQIAGHFNLTYLDREWLAQQRLKEEGLPADALSEIDDNEPTALNVLFTCYP